MRIIWLEDEPETITVIQNKIQKRCKSHIVVCKTFASFSDELETIEDKPNFVIIIDIRMIFNRELTFSCFGQEVRIGQELDSGFEYFNNCLKGRFKQVKIIFYSSKPRHEAIKDAQKNLVDTELIVSKEHGIRLIQIIKEIECDI